MSKITVSVDLEILAMTELSYFFTDGARRAWVQRRLIPNFDPDWEKGQTVEAEIPVWLAEKVGWV